MRKIVLAALAALGISGFAVQQSYEPLGFGGMGRDFGKLGAINKKKSAAAPAPACSDWKMDFSNPCNSMYIL